MLGAQSFQVVPWIRITSTMDTNIDTELLIGAIEEKRNIWDVSDETYKNRDAREKSWEDIAAVIIPNFVGLDDKEKKMPVCIYVCSLFRFIIFYN